MKNNMFVHNAFYDLMPNIWTEFLTFKDKNVRNYTIKFWRIAKTDEKSLKSELDLIDSKYLNIWLNKYLKAVWSIKLPEYNFSNWNGNENLSEKIVDVWTSLFKEKYNKEPDWKTDLAKILDLGMNSFKVESKKDLSDFVFEWKWKIPLWHALLYIKAFINRKDSNVIKNDFKNIDLVEEAFKDIVDNSNGMFVLSFEDEYWFDFTINTGVQLKNENFSKVDQLILKKDIFFDEHIYEDERKIKLAKTWKYTFLECVSRYDEHGDLRSVDSLDKVLKTIKKYI